MASATLLAPTVESFDLEWSDLAPLTVEQYHRMVETGILADGAPVELLDGLLVLKDRGARLTVSPRHRWVVGRLSRLSLVLPATCHVQLQGPITIAPNHEPEPDAAIIRGSIDDYPNRHPGPRDVSSLIEVAESSLERDRKAKLRIYSAAGIPQYLVVNVVGREVEIYEQPVPSLRSYGSSSLARPGQPVPLLLPDGTRFEIDAAEWVG
jgi:Putative restriction endonuclease